MIRNRLFCRGFSLIEAAIVLGIVGLVIGGIWVAASAVRQKMLGSTILEIVMKGHEKAKVFSKSAGDGELTFTEILSREPMPGGYKYDDAILPFITNGTQGVGFVINPYVSTLSQNVPGYFLWGIVFDVPSFGGSPPYGINPRLCIELVNRMLTTPLGRAPLGYHSIIWWDRSYTELATWDWGATKPDMAAITTRCQSTSYLEIYWAL